jgi:hypothetical protein
MFQELGSKALLAIGPSCLRIFVGFLCAALILPASADLFTEAEAGWGYDLA